MWSGIVTDANCTRGAHERLVRRRALRGSSRAPEAGRVLRAAGRRRDAADTMLGALHGHAASDHQTSTAAGASGRDAGGDGGWAGRCGQGGDGIESKRLAAAGHSAATRMAGNRQHCRCWVCCSATDRGAVRAACSARRMQLHMGRPAGARPGPPRAAHGQCGHHAPCAGLLAAEVGLHAAADITQAWGRCALPRPAQPSSRAVCPVTQPAPASRSSDRVPVPPISLDKRV